MFGEPESVAVVRRDGKPLSNGVPAHVFIPGWFGVRSDDIVFGEENIISATLENLSTHTKHPGSPRRPFLSSSHQRPDSLTSRSPLPRIFGHLPVPSGRFLARGLCLRRFGQLQTVSPQSKSKSLVSYLPSGGGSGAKDWNGSPRRVN